MKVLFILCLPLLLLKFTTPTSVQNWNDQKSNTLENLNCVFFINDSIGWICGDNGVVLKTTNSGTNWFNLTSSINKRLNNIHFINEEVGYISIGESGSPPGGVAKSTDGGQSWTVVSDFQGSVDHVHFQTEFDGWATSSGNLYQTTDGGHNWITRLGYQYSTYHYVEFVDSIGWVVGYVSLGQSLAFKTTDNGQNWNIKRPNETVHLHTVFFIEPYVWIIGDFGAQLFRSSDGGDSWGWFNFWEDIAYDVFFISDNLGYIVGRDGIIAKSTDSGLSWEMFNTNIGVNLNSVYFLSTGIGWAVGNGGIIVSINDTIVTSINTTDKFNAYSLGQNYPNPFNPTTTIKYQISDNSFVTIKVYDVLGNEITTLVNEEKPSGNYKVDFDATGLPSGIYFYQLRAGKFVETKKIVLLK